MRSATYLIKLAGYAVPARWLQNPRMARVAGAIAVALLSALTVMNTFASGAALVLDTRLAGPGCGGAGAALAAAVFGGVGSGGAAAVRWWG